jgi:hypothetical protein
MPLSVRHAWLQFGVITLLIALATLSNTACQTDPPELFPIIQNGKVGYINRKGEVVVAPQFALGFPFSEGLAVVCVDADGKCGFIDQTGKIVIPTEFKQAMRFSEGLAAIKVADKIGFIDQTGRIVIAPQFSSRGVFEMYIFSEGLAQARIEDKIGFIDKTGKFAIPTQFDDAAPFFDGLAAVTLNKKFGFIGKDGKFVIDSQFDGAGPFVNGLAAVKVGEKFGYVDKTGKIVISPQFDRAFPFSEEGLALVVIDEKIGFINRSGTYAIGPQFNSGGWFSPVPWEFAFFLTPEIGRVSFSEGLAPVKNEHGKIGYVNTTGKIVINYQFDEALPFFNGMAFVVRKQSQPSGEESGWIDKQGRFVWRDVKPKQNSNSSPTTP